MKLLELSGQVWTVYAVLDRRDRCPVIETLTEISEQGNRHADAMLSLLSEVVPSKGPPINNRNQCLPLERGISELKRGPKKGAKVRVLFFNGPGRRMIVCTSAFKKRDKTPQLQIDSAVEIKRQIEEAEEQGTLEIVKIDDWEG